MISFSVSVKPRDLTRHPARASISRLRSLAALVAFVSFVVVGTASAQVHPYRLFGRWTTVKSDQWGTPSKPGSGTHLALLRGTADSSWVLHWHDGEDERIWLAQPMIDTYPDCPSGMNCQWAAVPAAGNRLFCAGHSALADGKLLVVGGTTVQHTGLGHANVFDANTGYTWTRTSDMAEGRWYPTVTTLGNGKVVTFSGYRYNQMLMFGGVDTNGTRLMDQRPLNLASSPRWSVEPPIAPPFPAEGLEGASAAFDESSGKMFVFGGQNAAGYSDTLWGLFRKREDAGERWWWELWSATACGPRPSPRSRHTAVFSRMAPDGVLSSRDTMWVFGGLGTSGALGDLWRFIRSNNCWEQVSVPGGPGPRYGHVAVAVPPRSGAPAGTSFPQLLIWGGRTSGTALADDKLWALRLHPTLQWTEITLTGPPVPPRDGHTAIVDPDPGRTGFPSKRRVALFGGEGQSSVLQDTWLLLRSETAGATDYQWSCSLLTTTNKPAARTRHTAIYDGEFERLLVFGGDANGSTTAKGQKNDLWGLNFAGSSTTVWESVVADSAPAPRSGHCVVFHITPVIAKIPERFTVSSGSPPGTWQALTTASKSQFPYYPHCFGTASCSGRGME